MPVPFDVSCETREGDLQVMSIQGELDLSTAPKLEVALEAVEAGAGTRLLINLSDCDFIDSTGLALIVQAWKRLDSGPDEGPGRVVLCCPNEQVRRVLEVTGLDISIGLHDDLESALEDLQRSATTS